MVSGQYQSRQSPTSMRQGPYSDHESLRSNSSPEFQIPYDNYGFAGSQPQRPRPNNHKLNTTFPPTINTNHTASSPRQYGARPFARADSADPDFNRIKDYIPERTTSTPQHIHHFLEKMNYSLPQRRVPDTIERAAARNLQHLLGGGSHYLMENNNATFVNPEDRSANQFMSGNHAIPVDWMERLKYRQPRRPVTQVRTPFPPPKVINLKNVCNVNKSVDHRINLLNDGYRSLLTPILGLVLQSPNC